ncbi:Pisatin demethylase [Cytospora mali]|uniref:Pisatin demethylase n=1 Tax=Cytospora mali TaxID=578113 RepID=A0A194W565_CYTMA|nr:Pisatin demethylase [Valsa mali]
MALVTWSPTHIATVSAVAIFTYFVASTAYSWYRLRKVPGPFLAGITSLWTASVTSSGRDALIYQELAEKFGHLIRVGPNLLLTDDPETLRRMSGARSTYGKDGFYFASIKHPDHDTMFSTMNNSEHDRLKAQLAGPYGGRETLAMEPIVDTFMELAVQYFRDRCAKDPEATTVVNLAHVVNYLTLDIITRVAFGKELGFLQNDTDMYGLLAADRLALKTYTIPISVPWLRDITTSRWFLKLLGPKPTDKTGLGVAIGVAEKAVKKRFEPGAPDEKDLLGAFVRHGLQPGPTLSEALFVMVAGSDTTASAMRSTMLHLMGSPRVYQKLKGIILQAVSEGRVSSPIKQEEAKKIPYLQAVIYEGLRMRPPVPTMFPKVVPPQGDEINGIFVPGGTSVGWNLLPMMRAVEYWGRDPDVFRPERFMEADEKTRASMERLVEMVFGYGRFGCAGKPLAQMELHKFYFEMFRYFDFQLVNPEKPWNSEIWTIWMEDNFMVHVTESCPV